MRVLKAEIGEVNGLAFSPDGRALAAAVDQDVYLWNLESTGRPVRLDTTGSKVIRALYFTPDSRAVGWLGGSGWKVYDRSRKRAAQLQLDAGGNLAWIAQTPDGSRVVSEHTFPDPHPALSGWKSTDGGGWEQEWSVSMADVAFHYTAVCPSGERIATLARGATKRIKWETPFRLELRSAISGRIEATRAFPHNYACRLVFSPDGSQLVGVHDMTLMVWPVPALGEAKLIRNDSRQHFTSAAFHPTGRYLFASSNDTTVHVFDTEGWERVARFKWKLGRLRSVAVSPDGLLAAAGGDSGEVLVWDVDL
jgi:WD40 repeat protein